MKDAELVTIVLGGGAKLHQEAVAPDVAELFPGVLVNDDIDVAKALIGVSAPPFYQGYKQSAVVVAFFGLVADPGKAGFA